MEHVTSWARIKDFVNLRRRAGSHWMTFQRSHIHSQLMGSVTLMDTYRLYLTRAGYLEVIRPGRYRVVKMIPASLSLRACYRKAYPKESV